MKLERKPGSVFVTVPEPSKVKQVTNVRSRFEDWTKVANGIAIEAQSQAPVASPQPDPPKPTRKPGEPLGNPNEVRIYEVSRKDGRRKRVHTGVYTEKIEAFFQQRANETGNRFEAHTAATGKVFHPEVYDDAPPIVDPDIGRRMKSLLDRCDSIMGVQSND